MIGILDLTNKQKIVVLIEMLHSRVALTADIAVQWVIGRRSKKRVCGNDHRTEVAF